MNRSRKPKAPSPVRALMDRRLGSLLDTLAQQQQLSDRIRQLLPAPMDRHIASAQLHERRLVLHTDSPAWASRLRFHAPALLKLCRQQGMAVDAIQVRIQPASAPQAAGTRRSVALSGKAARHLRELAATLQDQELAAALQRLARRGGD